MSTETQSPLRASDEIRSKIVAEFQKFEPQVKAYGEYAHRVSALSLEYHLAKLREVFPDALIDELTCAVTLNVHETPKSFDTKLAQLSANEIQVKRAVLDRVNNTIQLFV